MKYIFNTKGQSLVELLLAIGLLSILLPAFLTGLVTSRDGQAQRGVRNEALIFLKESHEAMRNVREKNWALVVPTGVYYPRIAADYSWELVASQSGENINGYIRKIELSDVYRDTAGVISQSGTLDPSTRKVDFSVSWDKPITSQVASTTYLTRYLDNASDIWTTDTDFNTGTNTGTAVSDTEGGEVILGAGGQGQWCVPALTLATLDLPKSGVANAIAAIEGRVFTGTGENASGVSFANVNITNTNPPVPSILGTIDGYKTNDIFGEQNYAYIATDNKDKEIIIVSISSSPYSEIGYFNAPGNGDGDSIFVTGNTGYMTTGTKLYNFDLSSKSGSRSAIDSDGVTLAGNGTRVVVVGNYAYIAISGSNTKMQIIDLSNPSDLTVVGYANLDSGDGRDVSVNQTGTRAYLATSNMSDKREFFILDITNKSGNHSVIGSYDTNGMDPKGVSVVPGNRAIVVGQNGEEYQVININNETSLTRCGGLNVDTGVNGVATILETDGDAYSYIITGDAASELKIIQGGPGGQYASSGTYESNTFAPIGSYDRGFNRFDVTANRPTNANIRLQVAVAQAVSDSCNGVNFTYVGPGGDSNQYFQVPVTQGSEFFSFPTPFGSFGASYHNPGRCFRYKAYLSTTDAAQSPILYDFTVNYSP